MIVQCITNKLQYYVFYYFLFMIYIYDISVLHCDKYYIICKIYRIMFDYTYIILYMCTTATIVDNN